MTKNRQFYGILFAKKIPNLDNFTTHSEAEKAKFKNESKNRGG
jgi:hypothetical protein